MNWNVNICDFLAYVTEGIGKNRELFRSETGRLAVDGGSVQPLGEPAAGAMEIVFGNVGKVEHRDDGFECFLDAEIAGICKGVFRALKERLTELFRLLFGKLANLSVDFSFPVLIGGRKVLASEFVESFFYSHISSVFNASPFGEVLRLIFQFLKLFHQFLYRLVEAVESWFQSFVVAQEELYVFVKFVPFLLFIHSLFTPPFLFVDTKVVTIN